ncbi:MAG: gas vesicle protein [Desulfomonilaceae bacterium]|nr:gas vesicle protein [Desulfomonilaceae bacterium]
MKEFDLDHAEHVTLCEALDRVLNKGAVVLGEVTISVANVDLIYLGLQIVLTSIDTCHTMNETEAARCAVGLTSASEDPRVSS